MQGHGAWTDILEKYDSTVPRTEGEPSQAGPRNDGYGKLPDPSNRYTWHYIYEPGARSSVCVPRAPASFFRGRTIESYSTVRIGTVVLYTVHDPAQHGAVKIEQYSA